MITGRRDPAGLTLFQGYDMIFNLAFNDDEASSHYNENGVITRPAPIGDLSPHAIKAGYIGFGGNGHIGRINVNNQFYQAFGEDSHNPLAGQRQSPSMPRWRRWNCPTIWTG